jgi:hypothetical protein
MGVQRSLSMFGLTQKHETNIQDTRKPFNQDYAWALASAFSGPDMV